MTLSFSAAGDRTTTYRAAARHHPGGASHFVRTTTARAHIPVMLEEALSALAVSAQVGRPRTFVDATYGRGGHSAAILARMAPGDRLYALDRDPAAVADGRRRYGGRDDLVIDHCNFARLREWAQQHDLVGRIDGLLVDLGVSSPQLGDASRGFSFDTDGPLDMRMDPAAGEPVSAWLARASEQDIADVLWRYGEERNSRRIARRIVTARELEPLTRTTQLAALIASVPGPRSRRIHPATRSFQALRIHINGELQALGALLESAAELLAPHGRLVVISFHSLEDRLVKRSLRAGANSSDAAAGIPVFKRPRRYFPSAAEVAANPRSRSAVLRVAERLSS